MPDLQYEQKYPNKLVCGLDEVGRGSLAGPLVTAGVILPQNVNLSDIDDSKKIPKHKHEELVRLICDSAIEVRVCVLHANEVDSYTINPAVREAMTRTVAQFTNQPDVLLIDGNPWQKLDVELEQETITKGDQKSLSIACASLVAKYVHDQYMIKIDTMYPEFGFASNTGYGTKAHLEAIATYGVTPEHRMTYKPISTNKYKQYEV